MAYLRAKFLEFVHRLLCLFLEFVHKYLCLFLEFVLYSLNNKRKKAMLYRNIETKLDEWIPYAQKQAFLLTGARQVGKSYILTHFGKTHFKSFNSIDFIKNPAAIQALGQASSFEDFKLNLSLLVTEPLRPHESFLLFDEVQECPNVLTMIKYLVHEGKYAVALSGSLLGTQLENISSLPVGSIREYQLFPLDFEEFCLACHITQEQLLQAKEAFFNKKAIPAFLHKTLEALFRKFLVVGGMPQAVQSFIENKDLQEVRTVQRSLFNLYGQDITKYAPREERLLIRDIFSSIPSQLQNASGRFMLSKLEEVKRFKNAMPAFLWLTQAGVSILVSQVSEIKSPLELNKVQDRFKLYLLDTGLFCSRFSKGAALSILEENNSLNNGMLYENALAQLLTAHGYTPFYYAKKGKGEVDFVIETEDGQILALEGKSGQQFQRHASLSSALHHKGFTIHESFVFAQTNLFCKDNITYAPFYTAQFL